MGDKTWWWYHSTNLAKTAKGGWFCARTGEVGQVKAEEESKILPGIFLNRQRVANGSAHITSSSEERRG
jgi:hypothetical protein